MAYRIETSYDPDWRRWLAEILDEDGDFAGIAIGTTEQAAVNAAQQFVGEQYDAPAVHVVGSTR